MENFYESVVTSAVYCAVVCWVRSISVRDACRVNKLILKARRIIAKKLETFESVGNKRSLNLFLSWTLHPTSSTACCSLLS